MVRFFVSIPMAARKGQGEKRKKLAAENADPPASPERLAMAGWERRDFGEHGSPSATHRFSQIINRRRTQTIRIRWKLYDELLAAKNKRASSYPPTALVSIQILGCLRYAECFQVILHTLLPTIMFE
jgi:hypothetical protein